MAARKADVLCVLGVICFILYMLSSDNNYIGKDVFITESYDIDFSTVSLLVERTGCIKWKRTPQISKRFMLLCLLLMCGDIESCPGPTGYNIADLQQICKHRGLSIIHQNIRGIHSNFESLCATISTHNVDIITISETHLSNSDNIALYNIEGYDLITRNRSHGKAGGVCIYVKNSIVWERQEDLETDSIENIWIEIFFQTSHSFLLCCLYRPPDTSKYLPKNFN